MLQTLEMLVLYHKSKPRNAVGIVFFPELWGVSLGDLTVYVFSVADVLEVAARVLTTQLRLRPIRLQPRVVAPPVLGARRHAAGCCIPHCVRSL